MFCRIGFWVLFWPEVLATEWAIGGLPLDYHAYPTPESYVGEHLVCWLIVASSLQWALRMAGISPFAVPFTRVKCAVASYLLFGLSSDLLTSGGLWWLQVTSRGRAAMWVGNLVTTKNVLADFLTQRLITWSIVFCVVSAITYYWKGRARFMNQPVALGCA